MRIVTAASAAILAATFGSSALAQAPAAPAQAPAAAPAAPQAQQPMFSTTKVEGTDNVYIFGYRGYLSMFIVTPQGVIATDPSGLFKPDAVKTYISEIQKITSAPIKYVIYSHHHFDHAAGGQPFKELGARFIAHKNAKARIEQVKFSDVVVPDETVDRRRTINLGGTTLVLEYVGRNHSDNLLVMRLPKEKLIYVVDLLPVQGVQFGTMPDNVSPTEMETSIKRILAMEWDRYIPGHPGGGGKQIGTRKDAEDHLAYLGELSEQVKKAANDGKCHDTAMKEVKLPKYAAWGGYEQFLTGNIQRYCSWWARGY